MKKMYQILKGRSRQFFTNLLPSLFTLGATIAIGQNTTTLYVPSTGSSSLALCSGSFVIQDHAGDNNYANNVDGNYVFYAGAGGTISISGTYSTETNYDFVRIYSGVGTTGSQLAQYSGTNTISFTTTSSPTLTLRFSSDFGGVRAGFNFTVTYTGPCYFPPCFASPASNTITTTISNICPWSQNPILNFTNALQESSVLYSFQASTTGSLGPFTAIPNSTGSTSLFQPFQINPLPTVNTWYRSVLTCTLGGISTTLAPIEIAVGGSVVSTVPYFEGFEGIQANKDLPNCSWARSDNFQNGSRTGSVSAWRQARTGNKFAEFDASNSVFLQTRYFYSNGIALTAGVTYSASLWFATSGSATWKNLQLLYGPNQSTTGLVLIATPSVASQSFYQQLGNTFTVSTTGIFYLAIKATEDNYGNQLIWDDLSITAPCQFTTNTPNFVINGPTAICAGQTATFNVSSGSSSFVWNTGANTNNIQTTPNLNTTYSVSGTHSVTGCYGSTSHVISVTPGPPVTILPGKLEVCQGENVILSATGANSYTWSVGGTVGSAISVVPAGGNNTYTVIGSNLQGCKASAVQQIAINPLPVISVTGTMLICAGSTAVLTASGAGNNGSYQWYSNVVNVGTTVSMQPATTTTYVVKGTDSKGCVGEKQVVVAVDPCTGIETINVSTSAISVYPNPNNGVFTIAKSNALPATIELSDVTGRLVLVSSGSDSILPVDISSLANGVYYVKVISDNNTVVTKIIKQ